VIGSLKSDTEIGVLMPHLTEVPQMASNRHFSIHTHTHTYIDHTHREAERGGEKGKWAATQLKIRLWTIMNISITTWTCMVSSIGVSRCVYRGAIGLNMDWILPLPYQYPPPTFEYEYGYG